MRASRSRLTFPYPFTLSGCSDEMPAGIYDVLVEEERLEGSGFVAYRRTASFLSPARNPHCAARADMRAITEADLEAVLSHAIKQLSGSV